MMQLLKDLYRIRKILLVILTPIVLLPLPLVAEGQEADCGYVIILMAVFWITEALPIAVTALLPVFLLPVIGIMSVKDASQQYINNKSMLFVGGFIMAAAIERWNIHRRIALKIVYIFGTEPRWLMLGLMLPTWFISMWICNTSTTALMLPIAHAILLQLRETRKYLRNQTEIPDGGTQSSVVMDSSCGDCSDFDVKILEMKRNGHVYREGSNKDLVEEDSVNTSEDGDDPQFVRLCKGLTLAIGYAANIGGIATMTGAIPNLVFIGILDKVYEKLGIESPITFANWMGFCVPTSFVLLVFVWIWLQIFFLRSLRCCTSRDTETAYRLKELIKEEYRKLGPITFGQAAVIVHFIVLIVLWITRDMGGEVGWGHLFKNGYVREAVPATLIAMLLFVFPSKIPRVFCCRENGKSETPEPLISWKTAVNRVPWGIIFLLGSGFSIANASQVSGLSKWFAAKLSTLDHLEPWVLNMVLCFLMSFLTEFISNPAVCTLMMPILSSLALGLKLNPIYVMYPSALAASFSFMLPAASPPNAIVFSYGYVKVFDTVLAGFIVNIVCVLVLIGSTETIGESLFNFHTFPQVVVQNMTSN